jgi:hypothetical protein
MQQTVPTSTPTPDRPRPTRRGPSGPARLGPAGELLRLVAVPVTVGPYVAGAVVLGAIDVIVGLAR